MDTYGRTIILCLIYVIVDVNGQQGGGGLAIPWGQGVNINMADFDPFANLRGRRKPEPHAVIMDPHDPFRPKVSPDSPFVGGSSAGGWSKERGFSSYSASISNSNEASSSTKFGTQPMSRPHDSGGVAISLTGALPDFDPFRRSQDTRYDVKETPAVTNVNVPDTPTVRSVAKPTTGMGVPISFGVNLPDVTAEDPFMVGKFVEVPMDQGKRPTVVSGVGGSNMIVENKPKTVDIATSQQESFRIDSSNTNQVSTVDLQAPAVRPVPNVQQRVRQEPDLPFSRQPIIETQPAVDFMSSFLSQPIDPTRRGNGQKTVDTQTDISIVPLESQQTVSEPSQTLAQDAKSRDWRSFISTFLMGGGPGLEQMGPASFGPMDNTGLSGIGGQSQSSFSGSNTNLDASSQGQMLSTSTSQADIGSQGQMNVLAAGSTDRQMDVSGMGSMDSQMGVSGTVSTESQMGVTGMRPMDSQMGVSGTRSIDSQMDVSGMRSMDNQMNMAGTRSIDSQMDVSGTRSMDNQMNMAGTRSMDRQMGVSGIPSMGSQMDASGTPSMGSQMDVSRTVSMDRQAVGDLSRSQNQISDISTGLSSNLVQDKMYDSKPQLTDTITDQTSGQYAGQMENQLLSSIDTYKRASLDQSNGLSQGQIQEPRIVTADQSAPKEVKMADSTLIDSNPLVIDLTSSGMPADNVIPTGGVQASGINVGLDAGTNTQYDIAQSGQGQMENVVGLSETRPMDMPQAAEATSVSTKVSPSDASSSASASVLDLGLSEKPLTSFEGASPSDLQKLKLLEVAQRLLLQERGIQDPQAGSQTQTFTPLGMTGGLDSILSSLNQGNNMGEMIRSSLNQGSSQTLGMTSAQLADIASTKASKENPPITKPVDTTPRKNFQLGEWSSGVPVGTGGQDSVPIGNIFAGRFLQSGTELPSVGGTAVSPTAGIPIGQSFESNVLSTLSASTSGESVTTGSRGGGLIIKDKLPISFQRPCNAVRDPTSKYHFYRTVGAGRIRFRCALGTAFDDGTCECSIRVVSSGDCLEVFMNFNTGQVEDVSPNQLPVGNMNVEITNRTAAYPGIAVFDGNAKLTIWRYQNYDFRDHVMLKLRFRPGVGGNRYQTILANCDGSPDGPSIAIVFDKQVNELIMILRTTTNNDKNLRFKIDPNRWSEVTYLYDGDSFIGLVNNDRQSMPMKGLVEISDEALVLGHCPRFGNYNGAIDDVKIYTCIPKENRFLL